MPPPGAAGEHAPLRALALVAERPEGVEEKVDYRGHRRRYTQVRYGAAGTTRIAIAFDEVDGGQVELYVDADRDRAITAADRVPGAGPRWRLALELVTTSADDGPRLERPALLQAEVGSGGRASRATRTPPHRDPGRRASRRCGWRSGIPGCSVSRAGIIPSKRSV